MDYELFIFTFDPESQTTLPVWVFVWEKHDNGIITVTDVQKLSKGGTFLIMLPPGDQYYVSAWKMQTITINTILANAYGSIGIPIR